jgi:hypothetical protein
VLTSLGAGGKQKKPLGAAGMNPTVLIVVLSSVVVWFGMAVPVSMVARRLGKAMWVPFLLWCPVVTIGSAAGAGHFLHSMPPAAIPGVLIALLWTPGALYFWYLALNSRQKSAAAIFE